MNDFMSKLTCRNCGAPITSEICQYCGCRTGLSTDEANADYPIIECKEANLGFWTIGFPLIFAVGFGFIGGILPIVLYLTSKEMFSKTIIDKPINLYFSCLLFLLIGIIAAVIAIKPIIRYIILKSKGKLIKATVYGYTNDNVLLNNRPAQVVKLLADTPSGKRFLMYQLGNPGRPYGINTELELFVYKEYFLIVKKKETIDW